MASWLVCPTPERALRDRAMAGDIALCSCCVLGQDTLLSWFLSPLSCINGYRRIYCLGVTLRWTGWTIQGGGGGCNNTPRRFMLLNRKNTHTHYAGGNRKRRFYSEKASNDFHPHCVVKSVFEKFRLRN